MSFTTVAEMEARVEKQLADPDNALFTKAECLDAWYDGVLELSDETDNWVKRDTTTVATVASTLTATLPTDFIREMSITLVDSNSKEIPLTRSTVPSLDAISSGWRTGDTGQPSKYYIYDDKATIGFDPVPDDAYDIYLTYIYFPTRSATDLLVPFLYRRYVLYYVFAMAYQKKLENTQADKFFTLFERGIEKVKVSKNKRKGGLSVIRDVINYNYMD